MISIRSITPQHIKYIYIYICRERESKRTIKYACSENDIQTCLKVIIASSYLEHSVTTCRSVNVTACIYSI